ncbi:carboxypeptidase-like regulatory domain-containing protein [Hymenobacter sp. ASUV-10]|uniref:Carboxypeptidase-like regulatory domain-containing protein n=1 Tax=Hymenobacter aranciens TaxID=3063996 RepID=A0ABT9B951_9BACT|nr:carboxypeptidase-like regulatory domain-containing protein [Hymenobacter sp. ASUV-10]MDO7873103.1 carboxypeptidase-like regulatory domain-containing protein [Hymenobacter sp. ASUV-10]
MLLLRLLASLLLLSLLTPASQAQTPTLRGLVLDAETRQPIPNAQVGVARNRIGTSTNLDGRFALPIPAAYRQETLEVALLGYEPYRQLLPALPGPELRILLKLKPSKLGEVQVSGSVLGIVREAVVRIPQNYPVRPTRLEGFFRESDNDQQDNKYRYLAEAVLTVLKAPYTEPKDNGDIVIRQSRKVDLEEPTNFIRYKWYAGPFIPHRMDFVHNRLDFINERDFKDYDYRLTDLTTYLDRPVYVIHFGPKAGNKRANFEGKMYIDQQSYVFLAAEWKRTPAGIRNELGGLDAEERAYRVEYQSYAGRWHVKSVWYNTLAKSVTGKPMRHLAEYLTTAIDTAQATQPGYTARAQFMDVFLDNQVRYDSAFWQNHPTLLPPEQLRLTLRDRERQLAAEQLFTPKPAEQASSSKKALFNVLDRLRLGYIGGLLWVDSPGADLRVEVAPAGSAFRALGQVRAPQQRVVFWRGISYQLDVVKGLTVHYDNRIASWNFRGNGWSAGATYEVNLRPRHRPILLRAGLDYTRQRLRYELGNFDNPDRGLRLDGTKLDADNLRLGLQQRTDAWMPRLGLGVELSHRIEAVADLGWLFAQSTREELHLDEKSGFFLSRDDADVPLAAAGATVRVNGEAAGVPWRLGRPLLTVGLLYRLR